MNSYQRSSVVYSVGARLNFRIIVVGDSAVGKTSLVVKYIKGLFNKNYTVSLGVEFYSKLVNIENEDIVLQIWDTAGQQNFKSIVKSFYNKASCVIITYSDPELLVKTLEDYALEINEHALDGVRVMVARTKIDEKPISEGEANILDEAIKEQMIDFWLGISSKTGQNVEEFFSKVGICLFKRYFQNEDFREIVDPKKDSFRLNNEDANRIHQPNRNEKKKCCQ